MATAPERIADGVYRIQALPFNNAISILLLNGDDGLTLVDTGVSASVGRIRDAVKALSFGPDDLKRIFITHHHADHVGGLPGILAWAPQAEVWASATDAPVIAGDQAPDLTPNPFVRLLLRAQKRPTLSVTRTVNAGDRVAGFRVIATPGHTLGHVSLLRDADSVLFTADAFGCLPRKLRAGVRPTLCTDAAEARRSAEKLAILDPQTVVLSHGPVLRDHAAARLRAAATG